jgi:hypothetical protein
MRLIRLHLQEYHCTQHKTSTLKVGLKQFVGEVKRLKAQEGGSAALKRLYTLHCGFACEGRSRKFRYVTPAAARKLNL